MKYFSEINNITKDANAYNACRCFAHLTGAVNGTYASLAYAREIGASPETTDALKSMANKLDSMRQELHGIIHAAIVLE